jgi:type IV secretion system protein VirB9
MRHYAYTPGTVYTVPTSPSAPTYLVLPPGEQLAAPPTLDPDAWAVGVVQMGQEEATRQETVVLRPLQPGLRALTALLLQSGRIVFCKLVPSAKPGLMAVTWDVPQATPSQPFTPVALRPPTIDMGRLHTQYRIEPQGKWTPPWTPVRVFDDGTRTYMHFQEALTSTRAPGVFGLTPQRQRVLAQSHLYTVPEHPERGAWLIVHGLWPALELKDSAGLTVQIVRQAPPRSAPPEGSKER